MGLGGGKVQVLYSKPDSVNYGTIITLSQEGSGYYSKVNLLRSMPADSLKVPLESYVFDSKLPFLLNDPSLEILVSVSQSMGTPLWNLEM